MALEIDHFPGRSINTEKGSYLYFGGTAYLGLQTLPDFQEIFQRNLQQLGTTYAASRHSNVQIKSFRQGEEWLSGIMGSEKALYMSSGFSACQLVRKYFELQEACMFFAPHTHEALLCPGDRVHNDLEALKTDILNCLEEEPGRMPVLFFDTVDFAGLKPLQLEWLKTLPLQKLTLVADDSHGIGITGNRGGGSYQALQNMKPGKLLICGSLGKGFGIGGGFIAGDLNDIALIRQDPWFGGGGPGTAAGIQTLMDAEAMLEEQRIKLQENIAQFTRECKFLDTFAWSQGYPCFTISDNGLPDYLEEQGIVISNFHYPNADSPLLCRMVISAYHTSEDISKLTTALNSYLK